MRRMDGLYIYGLKKGERETRSTRSPGSLDQWKLKDTSVQWEHSVSARGNRQWDSFPQGRDVVTSLSSNPRRVTSRWRQFSPMNLGHVSLLQWEEGKSIWRDPGDVNSDQWRQATPGFLILRAMTNSRTLRIYIKPFPIRVRTSVDYGLWSV